LNVGRKRYYFGTYKQPSNHLQTWNISEKKVYKSAEFTPRRLNGVIILILYFMKNSMIELHHMNLTELNDFESEKTSGGWLILVALALEAGAALIEAAAVALAADMLVNPDRYKLAYQKGAAGK
jgi:hypothetical protein